MDDTKYREKTRIIDSIRSSLEDDLSVYTSIELIMKDVERDQIEIFGKDLEELLNAFTSIGDEKRCVN